MGAQDDHDQSRALSQLCSMIVEILKSPSWPPWLWLRSLQQLLRHCSLEFPWLFGSVTFVIGFVLMPWVFCLVLLFHFAAIVSHLSEFGKSIFCPVPRHHVPGKKAEPSFAILLFVELRKVMVRAVYSNEVWFSLCAEWSFSWAGRTYRLLKSKNLGCGEWKFWGKFRVLKWLLYW